MSLADRSIHNCTESAIVSLAMTKSIADMTHVERLIALADELHLPSSVALAEAVLEQVRKEFFEVQSIRDAAIREWTPERVDVLKSMWPEGATLTAIATRLEISRNAVAGKVHRLGIQRSLGQQTTGEEK